MSSIHLNFLIIIHAPVPKYCHGLTSTKPLISYPVHIPSIEAALEANSGVLFLKSLSLCV
jgi:hypothetical protein